MVVATHPSGDGYSVAGIGPIPLVGRSVEMAALQGLLETARHGAGGVVVLEGEAGIGKTRLVDELVARAGRTGVTALVGGADEMEPDRPLAALVEALGLSPGSSDPERAELARLVGGQEAEPSTAAGDLGFKIVESLLSLVERLTATGPHVLVVEDAHWADPLTVRALRAIGRRALGSLSVAMAVTLRPFPRGAALEQAIDDLVARGAGRLALEPLREEEARALAVAAGGTGAPVARVAAAGGNPLLVIELATASADEGDDALLSPTVAATVLRRFRTLPGAAVEALKVASVLGRRFSVDQLATVMDTTPVALLTALEDALAGRLLVSDGGELSFRHELIRETVYADLAPALRRGLHGQAARALSDHGAPVGQVAEHFLAGADPGDDAAIGWLAWAARSSAPRAPATAVKLLERASALAGPDHPFADNLAADLAPLLIQTGRTPEAEKLARQVLARGPQPAVDAALRRALGEVLWTQGMLEAAVSELDAAAEVRGGSPAERTGARALATNLRLFLGEPEIAASAARRLLDEGDRSGGDFARCLALQTLAVAADARAEVHEAVDLARQAVVTARHSSEPRVGHLHPHLFLGLILFDADRLDEAEVVLQEGRRRAEDRGTVAWLPLYHCVLAMRWLMLGALDDGLAEVDTGLALADEVGTRLYVPLLHGMAAWVALQRGDAGAGQAHMDTAAQAFFASASQEWQTDASVRLARAGARWPLEWGLWVQGLLLEANGDDAAAAATLESGWRAAAPLRFFLGYRLFAPDLVRLARRVGDGALAAQVATEVEEGARRSGGAGAAAAAQRCRALVDGDATGLAAAADAYRAAPKVMERAFACEDAGIALAGAGRVGEAVAFFEEGLAIFERAGATRPVDRVEAALRAVGVRRRRAGVSGGGQSGWDSLTPTERRVARLAAQGLTNRQIGGQLFVSRRTIETHLAHAFAKLGLSSRAQLAAEVARRG